MSQKVKKVFHLRKKVTSRAEPSQLSKVTVPAPELCLESKIGSQQRDPMSDTLRGEGYTAGCPDILLESAFLRFEVLAGKISTSLLKVTNKGSAALYYQWRRKRNSKLNPQALLDESSKFQCLNQRGTMKPGERVVFPFTFYSVMPGYFCQEFQLICQPPSVNPIPSVKLDGCARLTDDFIQSRTQLTDSLNKQYLYKCIKESVLDIVNTVKSPQDPTPDLSDPVIAEREFQRQNSNLGLYYNQRVFSWWCSLATDIWETLNKEPTPPWNLEVLELRRLIDKILDQCTKEFYLYRYNHYLYLSTKQELSRSPLYQAIYDMLGNVAVNISGDYNDSARRDLDMWEAPWKCPEEQEDPVSKKARDQELAKVKAEWLKKAKKKKWTEEDQKALVMQYRNKLSEAAKGEILNYFDSYQSNSQYIKTMRSSSGYPPSTNFFRFLEKLKTIKETDIENKKLLVKLELKERPDTSANIERYRQYLQRKQALSTKKSQSRIEPEKHKDRKMPKQVEPQLEDFSVTQIVNQDSLKELVGLVKFIQEKSIKLLTLLVNFGPRSLTPNTLYSLDFLHQYLRTVEPGVMFVKHDQIQKVCSKIEDDAYPDGTVLLLENCNYLAAETGRFQGQDQTHQMFAQQIVDKVKTFNTMTDLYVNENRCQQFSGITMFIDKQAVLGNSWWNCIGVCLKAEQATLVIGGALSAQKLTLVKRAVWYAREIVLVGEIGIYFMMVRQSTSEYLNLSLTQQQRKAIQSVVNTENSEWQADIPPHKRTPPPAKANIHVPVDMIVQAQQGQNAVQGRTRVISDFLQKDENLPGCIVVDVGPKTVQYLIDCMRHPGSLFIIGDIHYHQWHFGSSESVYRELYKMKEQRKTRHLQQEKKGINYSQDVVLTVVNDLDFLSEKVELTQKGKKEPKLVVQGSQEQQLGQEWEEQQEQEQGEQDQFGQIRKKQAKDIPDFYLKSAQYPIRLLAGEFNMGLSRISKYPTSQLD